MSSHTTAHLIFPHQLFEKTYELSADIYVLVEEDLFFTQYAFHKQKLILHRASMRSFEHALQARGFQTEYIETSDTPSAQVLEQTLKSHGVTQVSVFDVVDDWLVQKIDAIVHRLELTRQTHISPGFMTTRGQLEDYFSTHPNRMQQFYEWQRKRLDVMIEDGKPEGGKWSYDDKNRKPLPRTVKIPQPYANQKNERVDEAIEWVQKAFASNPGSSKFTFPVTHEAARQHLMQFLEQRFELFGPYEDAIAKDESQLFHSVLSPLLNIGLLTPHEVLDEALKFARKHEVAIESKEGFVRQLIGWREYMRATYVQFGRSMRTQNKLGFDRKLDVSWWTGETSIDPIDTTIKRVLDTAYAHHIERLMILGNSMVLLRSDPDDVYEWFMSMFIDAYDWVMVPNVYAMSQFAAGELITTKPYVSGSNYIIKMSDYTRGEWSDIWDALYWRFVDDYREMFEQNYRSRMMVKMYDKFSDEKKTSLRHSSDEWLG